MNNSKNILILMSTYNGEKYLEEQLQSIYDQDYPNIQILVRDDGSSDRTTEILNTEQEQGRLSWYQGANLGPDQSFWDLVQHAPEADFYAFADQDDFWMREKISTALRMLDYEQDKAALYFSQTQLTGEKLNKISNVKLHPRLTYGEALIAQFVGGCTMVFNKSLHHRLLAYTPQHLFMHDFWVYNVALALEAKVIFDSTPHILYRQHAGNAIGQENTIWFLWHSRIKRLWENKHIRSNTAQDLWNGYYREMIPHNRKITLWAATCKRSMACADKSSIPYLLQED